MTNFVNIIQQCEQASGPGSKQLIQAALGAADPIARKLITYALDPYKTFGLKQYDMPQAYGHDDDFDFFFGLLNDLSARLVTGDAAREAVTKVLGLYDMQTVAYLTRVLDKDLRAGFSADSANKAWKANPLPEADQVIPTFEVMLADKCDEIEDFDKYITFPCQADWKYDGQRTIAIVREGQAPEYRARSGKPMDHLAGTYDADLAAIRAEIGFDFVMDGESFASDFTETINAKKAGNQAAKDALRLRAFFLMPLHDWVAQSTNITMRRNREVLTELFAKLQPKRIEISKGREVKDFQDMTAYCNEVIDVEKQEGLILKDWDAVYTWDRSMAWCKVKRFYDVDCKITGFYLGKKKTKNEKRLGGIKVWGRVEDGTIVESDVGSGFTDAQRDEIWANQDKWLGATVVVKYQEVSKSKNKEVASLRFPTFEHRRDDKVVE